MGQKNQYSALYIRRNLSKIMDAILGKIDFLGIFGLKTLDYRAKNSKLCSILWAQFEEKWFFEHLLLPIATTMEFFLRVYKFNKFKNTIDNRAKNSKCSVLISRNFRKHIGAI